MSPELPASTLTFDVVSLVRNASGPMLALSLLLLLASGVVWFMIVLKVRQLRRWQRDEEHFEALLVEAHSVAQARPLILAHRSAIAGEFLSQLAASGSHDELLESEADYLANIQEQRVMSGLTVLASIASAAPLAGLFGTVYGIMEAFARIGATKSASLQIVAPAIGDALVTTILGLFAAIPAVVAVNLLSRRGDVLLSQSRAFARAWLQRTTNVTQSR